MKLPTTPAPVSDASQPRSLWDMIVTATPVAMTVLATILAGLSSSEMSQSQFYAALAAQRQSKAGDQWGLFQAKKLRGADAANSAELLGGLADTAPLKENAFTDAAARAKLQAPDALSNPQVAVALKLLATNDLPPPEEKPIVDEAVRRAVAAIAAGDPDELAAPLYTNVNENAVTDSLRILTENAQRSDEIFKPLLLGITDAQNALTMMRNEAAAAGQDSASQIHRLATDFGAARLRFDAGRYDREAKLNQQTAYLYEVMVRKTSLQSERHRVRSRYFFYGMLGAQAAVMIATFSLAVRERSWMWTVAFTIGVVALAYAGYVYLAV